jgi:PAS domain S-box-containing protein
MADNAREVFWLVDVEFAQILYASPAYVEIWGRPRRHLYKNPQAWLDAIHPEDRERVAQLFHARQRSGRSFRAQYRVVRPDGSVRWISDQRSPVRNQEGNVYRFAGMAQDITVRKVAEAELNRANRALLVVKECDEALARAGSESELLERICQIILKIDGMKMAWVGFADQDQGKAVRPVAKAGDTGKYLEDTKITWADEPQGRGPAGAAIRTRQVVLCRDICSDELLAPWRGQLLQQGFAAVISLPLIWEARCIGVLCIYSAHSDAFNQQEVDLLKQLAGDLTYGIVALRARTERAQLQEELLIISEREKQVIAQELHDGLCQHLVGTAMMGSLLQRRLASRHDPEADPAKQICDLLNSAASEARNLAHGLHPVRPEREGLMDALIGLAQMVSKLFQVDCTFRCDEPVLISNQSVATNLFRMAQEAVNNAMKHGRATRVHIALEQGSQGIALAIQDNGIGILAESPTSKGIGLRIMNHRAATIGATLTIGRAEEQGTVVRITLPA